MASLITVRLNKGDSPNWGFRLQGGKDFGTPLVIQKVNGGSPAERAGLIAGDSVIKINNTDVFNLLHKDAQDVIVRSGNSFDVTIQRGGSTWKPSVIPTGTFSKPTPSINNISPVTKTSLAASRGENIGAIGTGHNLSARPFSAQNGAVNGAPKLVNKQYNSPLKLYSEDTIAETLSAQTEVLSTGALGVNFKKNEKDYDATNSAVYRMLQEAEAEPKTSSLNEVRSDYYSTQSHAIGGRKTVSTPQSVIPLDGQQREVPKPNPSPTSETTTSCSECERVIVGVFVRIKDKNLHVECFKCATCGTSLKNVGYYNISNKLYCDVHAKLAAINNPSAAGLLPVTVPSGGRAPASAISSALSSHPLPTSSPLSPRSSNLAAPYQPDESKENLVDLPSAPVLPNLSAPSIVSNINKLSSNSNIYNNTIAKSFSNFINKPGGGYSGPKPFSSVSAPLSPRAAPLSPQSNLSRAPLSPIASAPAPSYSSYSPASSAGRFSSKPGGGLFKGLCVTNIIWPPLSEEPEVPTACPLFYPPPSLIEAEIKKKAKEKQLKLENEEAEGNFEVEQIISMSSGYSPYHCEEIRTYTDSKSITECIDLLSETLQTQKLIENVVQQTPLQGQPSLDRDIIIKPDIDINPSSGPMPLVQNISWQTTESSDLKRPTQYTPNTVECQLPRKVDNVVPQKWESPLTYAARTVTPDPDTFVQIPSKRSTSTLASALAIAPVEPFHPMVTNPLEPVPLPEETEPYFPPEHPVIIEDKEDESKGKPKKPEAPKQESPFVKALKIAPERPFTPVGGTVSPAPPRKKPKDPTDKFFEDLPKPQAKLDMRSALTTASERPYSPLITESVGAKQADKANPKRTPQDQLYRPLKPEVLPESFKVNQKLAPPPGYYNPTVLFEQTEMHSQESNEETESKEIRSIETTQLIEAPQTNACVKLTNEAEALASNHCLPIFQGFSCSFQNKTDHSQFSIEISTTPPVPTPPPKPQTPIAYIATVETKPSSYIQREIITEEKHESKSSQKHQQMKQEIRQAAVIEKQAEEVIQVKPFPLASTLRKPEGLPQYQKNLQDAAEADLLLMERKAKAQARLEEQKRQQAASVQVMQEENVREIQQRKVEQQCEQVRLQQEQEQIIRQQCEQLRLQQDQEQRARQQREQELRQQQIQRKQEQQKREQLQQRYNQEQEFKQQQILREQQMVQQQSQKTVYQSKPIITVQSGDNGNIQPPKINFQPVTEENKPSSGTFSPRPRALTPSMINKAPPVIPYYQSNLVAQYYQPLLSTILDPRSPGISRSPSPCPDRSLSPCPALPNAIRPRSPAAGPPCNPLTSSRPLPTPEDSKIRQAKDNLSTFIPEYKSQRDLVEKTKGLDFAQSRVDSQYQSGGSAAQHNSSSQIQIQSQTGPIVQESTQYQSTVSKSQNNNLADQKSLYEQQSLQTQDSQRMGVQTLQTADGVTTTRVSEKAHQEHLEALKKSQEQSTEVSSDGRTQVQRKTTITEEFEQTHKEKEIQIAKRTVSTSSKYPFQNVKLPEIENPVPSAVHRTNPQRNALPVCQRGQTQSKHPVIEDVCEKSCKTTCQGSCAKPVQEVPPQLSAEPALVSQGSQPTAPLTKHVFAPGSLGPLKHVSPPGSSGKSSENVTRPSVPKPDVGVGGGRQAGGISVAPKRGRGVLNTAAIGARIPLCGHCHGHISMFDVVFLEHVSEVHTNELDNLLELNEVCLQLPNQPDIPIPVPVYSQINISIPHNQCTSPSRLDSIGSSPKSDYSSYSTTSSSGRNNSHSVDAAREKIMTEIKNLTPRLKKVSFSDVHNSKVNYIVSNVDTVVTNNTKRVKSELLVPINDYLSTTTTAKSVGQQSLPDNLTFTNNRHSYKEVDKARSDTETKNKGIFVNSIRENVADMFKDTLEDSTIPVCCQCKKEISRGPFITALGKIWCPNHFTCATPSCRRPLQDLGFVEENGQLYCEYCFEQYLAPPCSKCGAKIKGDCLKAIGKQFHPECFNCVYCGKLFGNSPFFLEDGSPYCETDWNELFTTKCFACGFPVEAGDRWVEALNNNYHSQCFNCTMCKKNLEGQSFFAKGGRPFCKNHAR